MLKKILLAVAILISINIPVFAESITFYYNWRDYSFTSKNSLSYSGNKFVFNDYVKITPFMASNGRIYDSSALPIGTSLDYSISDLKYAYKFSLSIIKSPFLNLDYVGFYINDCSVYNKETLHCGIYEISFNDLMDSGYEIDLKENLINITSQTRLSKSVISLDPTITLIPNNTINKAFYNTTTGTCTNILTRYVNTEFTSTDYNKVNTSNNVRYLQQSTSSLVKCNAYKFTFNYTNATNNLPLANISSISLLHEGYWTCYWCEGSDASLSYRKPPSTWTLWTNNLNQDSESTVTQNFTSDFTKIINTTNGLIEFGITLTTFGDDIISSYTDYASITITYNVPPPTDTCTYSSGDWLINCNDNCTLSTTNTVNGNIIIYGSNGWLNFQSNQFAHAFYFNATNNCHWYYNNYRWLY